MNNLLNAKGQVSIEFTIVMSLLLVVFLSVLIAVQSIENTRLLEKQSSELKYLCNYVGDSMIKSYIYNQGIEVLITKRTSFEYSNNNLICKQDNLVSVCPLPSGVLPKFTGEQSGWVKV